MDLKSNSIPATTNNAGLKRKFDETHTIVSRDIKYGNKDGPSSKRIKRPYINPMDIPIALNHAKARECYTDLPLANPYLTRLDKCTINQLVSLAYCHRNTPGGPDWKLELLPPGNSKPNFYRIMIPWNKKQPMSDDFFEELKGVARLHVKKVEAIFEGEEDSPYYPDPATCYLGIDLYGVRHPLTYSSRSYTTIYKGVYDPKQLRDLDIEASGNSNDNEEYE